MAAARDLIHGAYGTTIMQNPYYTAAADRSLPYYGKSHDRNPL